MLILLLASLTVSLSLRNEDVTELQVSQSHNLILGADEMLNAGDVIKINVTVANTGTTPFFNVELKQDAPEIMVVCMPNGMNSTIGTLMPGVSEYCIGMYMISQNDIDAGGWMWNASFLNSTYAISVNVNLTQTTFGQLSVSQMQSLNLGMDNTITVGDVVTVNVKVTNIGTETVLNVSATNEPLTLGDLLPMQMVNYSYTYMLTEEDTLRGNVTVFNQAIGVGTTSTRNVIANASSVLDFSVENSRLLSISKEWTYTGPSCVLHEDDA